MKLGQEMAPFIRQKHHVYSGVVQERFGRVSGEVKKNIWEIKETTRRKKEKFKLLEVTKKAFGNLKWMLQH